MYLTRRILWQGKSHKMVGAIPADTVMYERPQGRGYVQLSETDDFPWPNSVNNSSTDFWAHEFHYSRLENLQGSFQYAYQVKRGTGIDGSNDGIVYKNVLGSYAHLRDVNDHHWVGRFVDFVRQVNFNSFQSIREQV